MHRPATETLLRCRYEAPIHTWENIVRTGPSPEGCVGRHRGEVARVLLIEAASFYHCGVLEIVQEPQVRVIAPSEILEQCQIDASFLSSPSSLVWCPSLTVYLRLYTSYQALSYLRWLIAFDVFRHVPGDSTPISYAALAGAAAAPVTTLGSVARMAMARDLFVEFWAAVCCYCCCCGSG
ncbi:hypothetical protein GGS23DRAFT_594464 [Durotheca rogersii]|uniref:uncharacterized protein n=1 Tax=Durotheca rogersii TaxID=419775 RepID=UPI00221FDB0E|nr:uncharacterized protein GGS23DRAFT_594464 [Durotheca rogersii]KAI5866336.1 hypothetical protein GGS23DRAFT_594464 [Durotheca rogersii]